MSSELRRNLRLYAPERALDRLIEAIFARVLTLEATISPTDVRPEAYRVAIAVLAEHRIDV